MNSTSIAPPLPQPTRTAIGPLDRAAPLPAPASDRPSDAAAEQRRWLLTLGMPAVGSAIFFAAAVGTGRLWLLGPAMLGIALIILGFVYLGLTSDANGSE